MKKQFTAAILVATVVLGATFAPELVWQQPHHYRLYIVKSGDTLDSIILKANEGGDVIMDVSEVEVCLATNNDRRPYAVELATD